MNLRALFDLGLVHALVMAAVALMVLLPRWRLQGRALRTTLLLLAVGVGLQLTGRPLTDGIAPELGAWLGTLGWLIGGVAIIRLYGLALFRVALPALGFAAPRIVEDIALVLAYAVLGLLQLREAGVDPSSLVTTSAVITAVIAFAMQDTLGNVLGGLFLELDDSLAIGDWIRVDDVAGQVEEIRWRHTALRTRNGERVVLPNSTLMRTRFTVLGNPAAGGCTIRRWIYFDATRASAPSLVIATAEQIFGNAEIANVAREPAPNCVLLDMNHGSCRYALRYWLLDPGPDDPTDSAVRIHLHAALARAGIELASPEQVVRQIIETPGREQSRQARELARRRTALARVDLFATLSANELDTLAGRLVDAPFAAGDVMTRQGAIAHWLYVLERGRAGVFVEGAEGARHQVATLEAGSVFGEMGLLTGASRRATVVALEDAACLRLDKAGFEDILHARPTLAEDISRLLAAREQGLDSALAAADASARHQAKLNPDTLMARMRAFFALTDDS